MPSTIEWTDETWNPTVGCSKVSPGCDNCYAVGVAHRGLTEQHRGLTIRRPGERPDWTGEVRLVPDRLDAPLQWRRPRRVFVDSMSDLFHPEVLKSEPVVDRHGAAWPFLAEVFATMVRASQHTFQVLTKRPQAMAAVLRHPRFKLDVNAILLRDGHPVMPGGMSEPETPWPSNIWLGTSIELDRYAWRANHLRRTPAAVRFLSLEPLLGPLPSLNLHGIDWVIAGGESGPGARPMHPAWVRDIRDRCVAADVPFFFKQWGTWLPIEQLDDHDGATDAERDNAWLRHLAETGKRHQRIHRFDDGQVAARIGKKYAGRLLDGRTWDEMPAAAR